jgi:hypothetical protein
MKNTVAILYAMISLLIASQAHAQSASGLAGVTDKIQSINAELIALGSVLAITGFTAQCICIKQSGAPPPHPRAVSILQPAVKKCRHCEPESSSGEANQILYCVLMRSVVLSEASLMLSSVSCVCLSHFPQDTSGLLHHSMTRVRNDEFFYNGSNFSKRCTHL